MCRASEGKATKMIYCHHMQPIQSFAVLRSLSWQEAVGHETRYRGKWERGGGRGEAGEERGRKEWKGGGRGGRESKPFCVPLYS